MFIITKVTQGIIRPTYLFSFCQLEGRAGESKESLRLLWILRLRLRLQLIFWLKFLNINTTFLTNPPGRFSSVSWWILQKFSPSPPVFILLSRSDFSEWFSSSLQRFIYTLNPPPPWMAGPPGVFPLASTQDIFSASSPHPSSLHGRTRAAFLSQYLSAVGWSLIRLWCWHFLSYLSWWLP